MKKSVIIFLLFASTTIAQRPFDIEGHRGTRGLMPENTIPAFKKAWQLGVNTLELDTVVTKDGKLVVSHDPFFSSAFSLDPQGNRITADKQRDYNIYKMTYAEVAKFDVGSAGNAGFPDQQKMKVAKPLLSDVFKELARFAKENKLPPPRYNIEIKMEQNGDDVWNPKPDVFAKMLYDEIVKAKQQKNVIVQSFDVRALEAFRKLTGTIPLSYLVVGADVDANFAKLSFTPEIYSPVFNVVTADTVANCRKRGVRIIPWTINEPADLERMKTLDLDGLITDYPDRAIKIFRK